MGSEGIMGGLGQQEDEKLVNWLSKMLNMLIVVLCSVNVLYTNSSMVRCCLLIIIVERTDYDQL